ncbi:protein of unknown function [Methylocella tundrae]|uniref:Uncharacterized protein n=1 Tax=Methylocella tundrae TaxID=227605 RepID=A0A4U8Z0A2_METTU|nr:protein of unknown function [Methylocella tundrae]
MLSTLKVMIGESGDTYDYKYLAARRPRLRGFEPRCIGFIAGICLHWREAGRGSKSDHRSGPRDCLESASGQDNG